MHAVSTPISSEFIKEGTTHSFMLDVIEASQNVPVIVDFWAPWCGPCKQLGPVLENAVIAAKGKVRMVKVNVDQNQQLAASMRVQSIPAVYVFYRGQPIDGFVGAVPESQLKAMVEKLATISGGEAGAEDISSLNGQAEEFFAQGKFDHAAALYSEILRIDPEHALAMIGLIRAFMQMGHKEEAKALIAQVPENIKKHKDWSGVEKMMTLADKAVDSGPLEALRRTVEAEPKNHQIRYDYAAALFAAGQKAEAVDHLLHIIRSERKWNDEQARKELVNMFEAMGHADPLTIDARKRLSTILFS